MYMCMLLLRQVYVGWSCNFESFYVSPTYWFIFLRLEPSLRLYLLLILGILAELSNTICMTSACVYVYIFAMGF